MLDDNKEEVGWKFVGGSWMLGQTIWCGKRPDENDLREIELCWMMEKIREKALRII
jgi:hypothetical protein